MVILLFHHVDIKFKIFSLLWKSLMVRSNTRLKQVRQKILSKLYQLKMKQKINTKTRKASRKFDGLKKKK
jgi:hypothetical protein